MCFTHCASKAPHAPRRAPPEPFLYAHPLNFSNATEPTGTNCANSSLYDLWEDGKPAADLVGKGAYIDDLFQARALAAIANFSAQRSQGGAQNLYLDYRPHSMHWPLMVDEATFMNHSWVGDDEPGCKFRFYGDTPWPGG